MPHRTGQLMSAAKFVESRLAASQGEGQGAIRCASLTLARGFAGDDLCRALICTEFLEFVKLLPGPHMYPKIMSSIRTQWDVGYYFGHLGGSSKP